jgi:hypothetical protein
LALSFIVMVVARIPEVEELALANQVLAYVEQLPSAEAKDSARYLKMIMQQINELKELLNGYPSIIQDYQVAGETVGLQSLVDSICQANPYTIEIYVPARATVGRTYLFAKFNLNRLLVRIANHHMPDGPGKTLVVEGLMRLVRRTVIAIIAEDILVSIASDQHLDLSLRRKAIYVLVDLWENRTSRSIEDFSPMLDSVWEAKTRVTISYGTLSGTSEILGLMREGCDPAVIDYFTRDEIVEEEHQALIELVFNTTYEEIAALRRYMERTRKQVLGPDDVAHIFNVPVSHLHRTIMGEQDIFFTFRERQVNAYHRLIHHVPGPKKTAEEYLMIYYLENADLRPPTINLSCSGNER